MRGLLVCFGMMLVSADASASSLSGSVACDRIERVVASVQMLAGKNGGSSPSVLFELSRVRSTGGVELAFRLYPVAQLADRIDRDFSSCAASARRIALSAMERVQYSSAAWRRAKRQVGRGQSYQLATGVKLPWLTEVALAAFADAYRRRGGPALFITSGHRTPLSQAEAMYAKLMLKTRLDRLYRQYGAAREIIRAFRRARRRRLSATRIVQSMRQVIDKQVCGGVFVSQHLRAGAVDIRTRTLTRRQRRILRKLARAWRKRVYLKVERRPPHFHLEFLRLELLRPDPRSPAVQGGQTSPC